MRRIICALLFVVPQMTAAERYDLTGRIGPRARASVSLYAVTSPFTVSAMTDAGGRFTFKRLEPGTYTISVFLPNLGEFRRTIEIGPSPAGPRGRVNLDLNLRDSDFNLGDTLQRRHSIDAGQLAIPDKAIREYQDAQKELARRDTEAAIKHLERAVEFAPQYTVAWNNLGTIAYQTRNYPRAEECFREALDRGPLLFEPLVNLGGVLINLHKLVEAREYNLHAVLMRPRDALANSQLGMTYFELGDLALAGKYLEIARSVDPAHFSHPQLFLAEIHLRRGDRRAAAADLAEFLKYHPDWHAADQMRSTIDQLRK